MLAATQRLFDRGEGRLETRIIGADIAQLDHLEQAGVEVGVAEGGAIMARRLVPGLALDRFANLRRAAIPMGFAIGHADACGAVAEPVERERDRCGKRRPGRVACGGSRIWKKKKKKKT